MSRRASDYMDRAGMGERGERGEREGVGEGGRENEGVTGGGLTDRDVDH